jgi:vitamin B12 transporter
MVMSGWACAADSTGTPAGGEEEEAYSLAQVTVEAKRPDWESKLSPGTVTVIRPDDYKGEQKDLADFLKMVPGVHVREVNGKGQYTTVSVRGSTAAQVGVFVDGILFNLGGDAAADISTIPVKNVERIEVYRGYIPARFGGTYMGGVVNIVTKKPTKANVSASVGKKSYGGYSGSVEVDAPLGNGALMIGVNRDQSKGDFKYKNISSDAAKQEAQRVIDIYQSTIDNFTVNTIKDYTQYGWLTEDQEKTFLENTQAWNDYWSKPTENGKSAFYNEVYEKYYNNLPSTYGDALAYIRDYYPEYWNDSLKQQMKLDWRAGNKGKYAALYADSRAQDLLNAVDPDKSGSVAMDKKVVAQYTKNKNYLGNGWRWRRYNDYKNTDVITKWQNNHWTVKGTWKQVLRHLPRAIDGDSYIDTDALYYGMAKTRQNLIDKEMLVSWRNQAGRLDWGWTVDYLDQQKRYRCENWEELDALNPNTVYSQTPFRKWSAYNSHKWNGGIDGTYHAGDRNLIEFYANYSDETMRVRGSGVTENLLKGFEYYNRYRTHYTQKMTNIQVQDTITLDDKGTLWISPSIRYNRVRTHSNPTMAYIYAKEEGRPSTGMYEAITQNNHKTTWQIALKKQVNDRLTLRTTGGTYYRMLNLYEIAGDGGGIMPASLNNEKQFAKPEEGKQYDISAIWDGPVLGARTGKIQVTYFYRDSTNLLQLYRWGLDYWSYTNTLNGHSKGVELQIDQSWKKWDFSAGGTYLRLDAMNQMPDHVRSGPNYPYPVHQTYTPDWEGYLRLAYHPGNSVTLFGQVNYTGKMYTSPSMVSAQNPTVSETRQDSLTTVGLGGKYRFPSGVQLTVGCNDIFNHGPKVMQRYIHVSSNSDVKNNQEEMPDYPIQGRTWYATMQYNF